MAEYMFSHVGIDRPDRVYLQAITSALPKAVNFAVPDGGRIVGIGGLEGVMLELPYPVISIETTYQDVGFFILAIDNENHIDLWGFTKWFDKRREFLPITKMMKIEKNCRMVDGSEWGQDYTVFMDLIPHEEDVRIYGLKDITACGFILEELLCALTCRNIEIDTLQQESPKNQRRIKAGKLPIYETKVLTLKVNETVKQSGKTGFSHASPRQHLRRGHIRRHPTAGNIWVNNCVVGSAEKGFIEKQYKIAA